MDHSTKHDDVWQYGTYEGAERLRMQQEAKLTLSQKLDLLDEMIDLSLSLHRKSSSLRVAESSSDYKAGSEER